MCGKEGNQLAKSGLARAREQRRRQDVPAGRYQVSHDGNNSKNAEDTFTFFGGIVSGIGDGCREF